MTGPTAAACFALAFAACCAGYGPYTEREALCDIRTKWSPPSWVVDANFDPCRTAAYCAAPPAASVRCAGGHVVALDFADNMISAGIPPSLSGLSYLQELIISGNSLYGPFPEGMEAMSNLRVLDASGNMLNGTLEFAANLSSLVRLCVDRNQFSGELPKNLEKISSLEVLSLNTNGIVGTFPSFHNLKLLKTLDVSRNQLSGFPGLQHSTNLQTLILSTNSIRGSIPEWIGKLTSLTSLNLDECELSGVIPPGITELSRLESLLMSYNSLEGPIPEDLSKLTALTELSLGNNRLTGTIPEGIGRLLSLSILILEDNQLTGAIPASFGNLTLVDMLDLSDNNLSGSIPNLSSLAFLETLDISDNKLSGKVPHWLSSLPRLLRLDASGNEKISGKFPSVLCDTKLIYVDLTDTGVSSKTCKCCTRSCFCKNSLDVATPLVMGLSFSLIAVFAALAVVFATMLFRKPRQPKVLLGSAGRSSMPQSLNSPDHAPLERPLLPAADLSLPTSSSTLSTDLDTSSMSSSAAVLP